MENPEIGNLVRATGLKQAEIAEALDVNVSTVRRWVAGGSMPSEEHIEQLKKLAGGTMTRRRVRREMPSAVLAGVPSDVLIQELARRSRGGILRDAVPALREETL
jgi:transcriptional regulator with XRE-family HTH domain